MNSFEIYNEMEDNLQAIEWGERLFGYYKREAGFTKI
jgi:predicted transcriptional regulator